MRVSITTSVLQAAVFDFTHIPTSDRVLLSSVMLLDTENMGRAVGISLLSRILAHKYIMPHP